MRTVVSFAWINATEAAAMALGERTRASRPSRALSIYLGVLGLVFLIIAGASIIWRSTDNSGTNMLATDPQSTSPPAQSSGP